ncbi:glycosyltransferase family 39 protein [Neoroseomonas soli]|uniref:Glycosyltransferase RgtA/B/C/D-like domain-containing protein n=1 Tax=Neoroseomonas soli TaxID=1081025 RepID=A0A9X9WUZ1_9PROT|nr:hypothetical protein [Neoroseomonas soli]MBR0670970.1 hypothetical protein [Neoroseomonas soli]
MSARSAGIRERGDATPSGGPLASGMSARTAWALAGGVFLLALLIRLIGISLFSLDGDEVFSVLAANDSWVHLIRTAAEDKSHPPGYYALLHVYLGVAPEDDIHPRIISALAGAALPAVAVFLGRAIGLRMADLGLLLLLITVNDALIFHSQYARMFSLFHVLSALNTLFFVRLCMEPGSRREALAYAASGVAMVHVHYWGFLVLVTQLAIRTLGGARGLRTLLIAQVGIGIAFLPWVGIVAAGILKDGGAATTQIAWMGTSPPGLQDYAWLFARLDGVIDIPRATTLGIALFLLAPAVAALHAIRVGKPGIASPDSVFFWMGMVAVPLALTSGLSVVAKQNLWGERHLLMVALPYFALVALSLSRLAGFAPPVAIAALRLAIAGWAVLAYAGAAQGTDTRLQWRDIAAAIQGAAAEGGAAPEVVALEPFIALPLQYYLRRQDPAARVVVDPDFATDPPQRDAWLVYRVFTRPGPTAIAPPVIPEGMMDRRVETATPSQRIIAVLLRQRGS